jgi:hypothetical protein
MVLQAIRPIAKNDEITIAYIDILKKRQQRWEALEASYGFTCGCNKCKFKKSEREASDKKLTRLRALIDDHDQTFSWWFRQTAPSNSNTAIALARKYPKSLDDQFNGVATEGLESLRSYYMGLADSRVHIYGAFGDDKEFIEVINQAIELFKMDEIWSESVKDRILVYEGWKKDPKTYPHYGKRSSEYAERKS